MTVEEKLTRERTKGFMIEIVIRIDLDKWVKLVTFILDVIKYIKWRAYGGGFVVGEEGAS